MGFSKIFDWECRFDSKHGAGLQELRIINYLQVGLVCAEVVKVSKHPNADRLKVCQVRTDIETLQVVTNAPNVIEGMKVAFAVCTVLQHVHKHTCVLGPSPWHTWAFEILTCEVLCREMAYRQQAVAFR